MENRNHVLKRVLACVMVVVMAVTAVPMSGFVGLELPKWSEMFATRANAENENGFYYSVSNGEATITGCDEPISGDVVIPDTLGGYPVTSIGNCAFEDCTGLTSITFPDSVTSIDGYAFYGCTGLTNVTIPDSITSIGYDAFEHCSGLTSVTIGNSVTSIGSGAFSGCSELTSVTIPDSVTSIGSDAFADTAWYKAQPFGDVYAGKFYYKYKGTMLENTSVVIKNGTKGIAGSAFCDCDGLTSITIPDSVINIGDSAFSGCYRLTNITIPDRVTSIGNHAFSDCGITSVTIPDSVTSIESYTFSSCFHLTSITMSDSVTSIGDGAFYYCPVLKNVIIPDSVTSIDKDAFEYCGLTSVTIGNGVETISSEAFNDCSLTTIKIGKNVKTIEKDAFKGIKSIPEVYYAGSEADWKNISIDPSNDMILRAKMYYNADITHTHSYTSALTKKATCTESGVKTYTCNCGKIVTKSIPATGHKYKTENQAASCTSIGVSIKKCTVCGKVEYANTTPATGHTLKTAVTPATQTESGFSITSCKICGTITKATFIKRIASVTLSATKYTYNGKVQTPTVTVKDSAGKVLKKNTDYTISYASGRKNPGKYTVKVTFKGNYTGEKTLTFTIAPATPTLSVTAGAKKATLKWNKQTGATGYVVYMATSQNGKYTKIATIKNNGTVSMTKTGLTTGKTYYFKVAAYKTVSGKVIYSGWSAVKGVKIK